MTTKTILSSMLLAGLVAMAGANAQEGDTGTTSQTDVAVMGEGEIQISEALANALVESDAATDFDTALDTVLDMRADGMGWGEIAQELGFDNLGLIVADAMSEGRSSAGLAIAEENRNRGEADVEVEDDQVQAGAGAETAASARLQGDVGRGIAADARANARIDGSLRGSTSGRPAGVGAPTLPQSVVRPSVPTRPVLPQRPQRGGRGGGG